jgi:replicative DNA helicase
MLMIARIPPYSEEAERAVIGSAMMEPERVLGICSDSLISADSFYVPAHRIVFETILSLASNASKAIDLVTVGQTLEASGRIEQAGGWAAIQNIVDSTPTSAHAQHYAEIIRDMQTRRSIISASAEAIDGAYKLENDTQGLLSETQHKFFDIGNSSKDNAETTHESALAVVDRWGKIIDGTASFGLKCFLSEVGKVLGGFVEGNPYFIAAEPGGGKSIFVQNQLTYWSLIEGRPCAIASLEMTRRKFTARILGDIANLSAWAMDNKEFGASDYALARLQDAKNAAESIRNMPLHINDRPMNVDEFCAWGLRMKRKHGIEAIGVDYLQLLNPPDRLRLQGIEALKYVCGKLQAFSKATGVITLVLSQLVKLDKNTEGKKRRPVQDDMFGGRIIDATSEGTIMLYEWDGDDIADIVKNRNGGKGRIPVIFDRSKQRFTCK